jgi:regulator of sigma E protease
MLVTVVVFLIILSILIFVHELGHFTAAKKLGIRVEEFGFGLPPKIFGIKRGETLYSVNWLPLGGFVKLFGEEGEESGKRRKKPSPRLRKRAFYAKPAWQKVIVLLAGVGMNFLLAVIVISYLFTQGVMVPTNRVHIEQVLTNSPALSVGLMEKDIIKKIIIPEKSNTGEVTKLATIDIKSGDQLTKTTKAHLGKQLVLVIERGGQELSVNIIPRKEYPQNEGPMGIVISNFEEKRYPIWQAPVLGMKESVFLSYELGRGIATTLWKLVSFQPVAKDVAGPIGIAQMTGQAVKSGESAVLELLGLLSLNLAIVNVLPFPALDGGRLLFVVIEGVTGKKLRTNWERYIHQAGMIILLMLMLLVTINDLLRIFAK